MEIDGYKILEQIGQGGMAKVFKGYQVSLQRPVAIKVLTHHFSDQEDFIQRFEKESIIIARLSNPFIIPVIERGLTEDGIPYFIMEYVEGHDLGQIMKMEPPGFNRKLDTIIQICKALSYAHRNNVVHRDIKPANILIDNDGNARVLDFGIAQYFEEEKEADAAHTQAGMIMGTLAYMSPEQRLSSTAVTFKSDLFSLGVLMYKFFTGQDPVGHLKSPEELEPQIPSVLSKLILQCLAVNPDDRPASADAIKDQLLLLLRGAHLQTEQREQVQKDFKQFDLLDVIKDDKHSSVMLFENRSSKKLIVIKKRLVGSTGFKEAQLLTPLKHPNLVRILGTSKNKKNYIIVMEYLNGGNLQDRLVQAMKWREFIPLAQGISAGMAFAHEHKILHGNLRPSNILFNHRGQIKLADFGLEEHYSHNNLTRNWYRIANEKSTVALDIFSVGAIFYQMLVGVHPELDNNGFEAHTTFRQLPARLKQLISQMLRVNPMERITHFNQVSAELDELAGDACKTIVIAQKQVEPVTETTSPKNYRLYLILLFCVLIVVMAILVDWQDIQYYLQGLSSPQPPEEKAPSFIELN